ASYEFGVVCEARADRDTACGLADRVLLEKVSWLAPETLDSCRHWRGLRSADSYLRWASVKEEVRRAKLAVFGGFKDGPGEQDSYNARRALLLLAMAERRPDAVVLMRDGDAQRDRAGLEQARNDRSWPFRVIIGLAEPKRECWVLAGFDPRNDDEAARLEAERQRLSCHPVRDAHQLTAREHGAKKDAKVALDALTQGDKERERACLEETPLAVLEERGGKTGLAEYLKEVRERLVSIL
ncbi:MAG TPA: hypothetical protein VEU33_27945, partial [Archangium sp.]|nr:hypothetical protein [Archangium sp.]